MVLSPVVPCLFYLVAGRARVAFGRAPRAAMACNSDSDKCQQGKTSASAVALSYLPALSRNNSHGSLGEVEGVEGSAATAAVPISSGSAISDAGVDSAASAKAKYDGGVKQGQTAEDAPGQGRPEQRLLGSRRLRRLTMTMVPGKSDGSKAQDTGEDSTGGAGPGPNHEGSQRQLLAPVPHENSQRQLLGAEAQSSMHAVEFENVIEVLAEVWGRTYYLKAETPQECEVWVAAIAEARAEAEAEYQRSLNPTWWAMARARAKRVYVHPTTQIIIAMILLSNFIVSRFPLSQQPAACTPQQACSNAKAEPVLARPNPQTLDVRTRRRLSFSEFAPRL